MVAAMLIAGSDVAHAQQPGTKRTDLQRHDLDTPGREVVQVRVDFDPGYVAPKHTHFGEEIIYVLEGTLEYRNGQRSGTRHLLRRKRETARFARRRTARQGRSGKLPGATNNDRNVDPIYVCFKRRGQSRVRVSRAAPSLGQRTRCHPVRCCEEYRRPERIRTVGSVSGQSGL